MDEIIVTRNVLVKKKIYIFLVGLAFCKSMKINDKFMFLVTDVRTVMVQNVIFPHGFGAGVNREGAFFSICRRRVFLLAGFVATYRNIGITRKEWIGSECFSVGKAKVYASPWWSDRMTRRATRCATHNCDLSPNGRSANLSPVESEK